MVCWEHERLFSALWGSLCADPYGTVAVGFPKVTLHRARSIPGRRLVKGLTHCWLCKQPAICKAGWICLKQSAVYTSLNQVHLFHLCLIDKLGVIKTNFRFIQFIQIFLFPTDVYCTVITINLLGGICMTTPRKLNTVLSFAAFGDHNPCYPAMCDARFIQLRWCFSR